MSEVKDEIMREFRFACGSIVRAGDGLTHPDRLGYVLRALGMGGYDGSWCMTFWVEIDGVIHHSGSRMGCEKYTLEEFVLPRMWGRPTPEPEPEQAAEYAEVNW